MSTTTLSSPLDLRYPIGRYQPPEPITAETRAQWIATLQSLPARLREATGGLDDWQLDTPYRPDGWTVRQLLHHIADSHLNSYARFRLALTEDSPLVKPYSEKAWAELPDAKHAPAGLSLQLLEALHARWVILLSSLSDADFARTFNHAERGPMRLDWALGLYAWHSNHHLAHITALRKRENW